ncbi:MAG: AfsR/SARP family transcriptional regulator [Gemmatimonadaceae bacterium]
MIRLCVLGTLEARDDKGCALDDLLAQPKAIALLLYLVLARPRGFHQRDRVVGLLWSELPQERARASLRKALHRLRQSLGDRVLVSRGTESIGVSGDSIWVDAIAFDSAANDERLGEAFELYSGDLVPGFFVSDSGEFEAWLEEERARYRTRAIEVAWSLVERLTIDEEFTNAAQLARRVARLASADERMVRRVMTMLARLGDRAGAVDIYRQFAQRLWKEYETQPSPETLQLLSTIQAR